MGDSKYFVKNWKHLKNRADKSALLDEVPDRIIGNSIIVRNHKFQFQLFKNWIELENHILETPIENREFHEVIINWNQKMRFDIDAKNENYESLEVFKPKVEKFLADLLYSFQSVMRNYIGSYIDLRDLVVMESHSKLDPTKHLTKISFHVVYPYIKFNSSSDCQLVYDSCRSFMISYFHYTKEQIDKWFDGQIYKNNQCFRLLHCVKVRPQGEKSDDFEYRPLTLSPRLEILNMDLKYEYIECHKWQFVASLISVYFDKCYELPRLTDPEKPINQIVVSYDNDIVKRSVEAVQAYTDQYQYSGSSNILNRVKPGFCSICSKVHDKMGGYFICKNGGVSLGCFRSKQYNNGESKFIELIPQSAGTLETIEKAHKRKTLQGAQIVEQKHIDMDFSEKLDYYVKSATGTGKTTCLCKYFENHKDEKVIVLGQRILTEESLMSTLRPLGFVFYKDKDVDWRSKNRVVVQMESLGKMRIEEMEKFDTVILDEFMSVLNQLSSPNFVLPFNAIQNLAYLLSSDKKFVCMDAYLDDERISQFRNRWRFGKKIRIIQNTYQNKKDEKIVVLNSYFDALATLKSNILAGKNVFVACDCKIDVESIREIALKSVKDGGYGLKSEEVMGIHGGNSGDDMIRECLKNVSESWKKRLVIINSAIENGVSFDPSWFNIQISIFHNAKIQTVSHLQMLNRIRTKMEGVSYIYFGVPQGKIEYTRSQIEEYIKTRGKMPEFDPLIYLAYLVPYNGRYKILDHPIMEQLIDNELYFNQIFCMNRKVFWDAILDQGYRLVYKKVETTKKDIETIKNIIKTIKEEKPKHIANADLSVEIDGKPKTDTEMRVVQKKAIIDTFKLEEKQVTPQFVAQYGSWPKIRAYKNRIKLWEKGFDIFIQDELNKSKLNELSSEDDYNRIWKQIFKKQITPAHKIVCACLLRGFVSNVKDLMENPQKYEMDRSELVLNIGASVQLNRWDELTKMFSFTSKIKQEELETNIKETLHAINSITDQVFGIVIDCKYKNNSTYMFECTGYIPDFKKLKRAIDARDIEIRDLIEEAEQQN